jgi:anti-sigma B factor antagonist
VDIRIEVRTEGDGRTVLSVDGAIDLQTRAQLLEKGQAALGGGAKALVLDLAEVSFIDSTGIGAMVELAHDADDASAFLVIRNPSARVERILELTGLGEAWQLEYDAD